MKGQAISLTRKTITILILAVVLVGALFFIYQIGLVSMLSGMCGNGDCDAGETALLCPQDCYKIQAKYFLEHVIIVNDSDDTFGSSDPADGITNVLDYLSFPPSSFKEDCTNCKQCTNCTDVQTFINADTCTNCFECDKQTGDCIYCALCEEADSDYNLNPDDYVDCDACYDCHDCTIDSYTLDADVCTNCDLCETCEPTEFISTTYDCDYCSYDNGPGVDFTGCMQCFSPGIADEVDVRSNNYCDSCLSCSNTNTWNGHAACWAQEPWLCNRVKKCIENYDGTPCEIDGFVPVLGANQDTDLHTTIINTLSKCRDEKIYREFSDNGKQFLCDYVSPLTSSSMELTPLKITNNPNHTFLTCGSDSRNIGNLIYNNMAFNANPDGMTYKITLGQVDYNENNDNVCRYSMYLCGQPAITSIKISDANMWTDSDILDDPLSEIYDNILKMDMDVDDNSEVVLHRYADADDTINTYNFKLDYHQIIMYDSFIVDFGSQKATPQNIADIIVAGTRDWIAMSKNDAQTINKITEKLEYENQFNTLEQGNVEWQLSSIPKALRPSECAYTDNKALWHIYQYMEQTTPDGAAEHIYTIPADPIIEYKNDYNSFSPITTRLASRYRTPIEFYWERNDTERDDTETYELHESTDQNDWDKLEDINDDWKDSSKCNDVTTLNPILTPEKDKVRGFESTDENPPVRYEYLRIKDGCNIKYSNVCVIYNIGYAQWNSIYYEETEDGLYSGNVKIQVGFMVSDDYETIDKLTLTPLVSFAEVAG